MSIYLLATPYNLTIEHAATSTPPQAVELAKFAYKSSLKPSKVALCNFPNDVPNWLRYELANIGASCSEQQTLAYIAKHESTYNPNAKNPTSSARGLMQFLDSSFNYYGCYKYGGRTSSIGQLKCSLNIIRTEGAYNTWFRWW